MTHQLRIAVADDEPDIRDYFSRILPLLGHHVVALAENGRELLTQCQAVRPDLVITDIRMPDMDGIEAACRLSQQMRVPVIIISADPAPELIQRAEADHVVACMVKPIKLAHLQPTIALAMRRFEVITLRRESRIATQSNEPRQPS